MFLAQNRYMEKLGFYSKRNCIKRKWCIFFLSLFVGVLFFFSFPCSVEASDSDRVILHNLTGRPESNGVSLQADLLFSLQDQNGNLVTDAEGLETHLLLNREEIKQFILTDACDKNIHYIFVLQTRSEEVLRQVLTFITQQDEADTFSLAGAEEKIGHPVQGLSKNNFGQSVLDYFYAEPENYCLNDQILQALMLARQSQEELQAILVIKDHTISARQTCMFDFQNEVEQVNRQPFFIIPMYYLESGEPQIDNQLAGLINNSGGRSFQTDTKDITRLLNLAADDLHSKLLIRFDTEIKKSINVLELSLSKKEKVSGLELFFTWDNLGKKYTVTIEESSKNLSMTDLESLSVEMPRTVVDFLKFSSAVLVPVSLIGALCLAIFLRKENKEEKPGRKQNNPDFSWYEPEKPGTKKMASLRILQSEAEALIGQLILLNQASTRIGRSRKNDIVLEKDKNLLENQAVLTQKGGYAYIETNSRAGFTSNMDSPTFASFLNNSRLTSQPVMLNDGDIIRLGPTVVFEFRYN